MDKFRGKYRIPSARAPWWDYARAAAYFITICTKNRLHFFGRIIDKVLFPSAIGKLVETEWLKTPSLCPDMNIILDEYQVMPNHFHGIIVIGENKYNQNDRDRDRDTDTTGDTDATHTHTDTHTTGNTPKNQYCILYQEKSGKLKQ